MSADAPSAFSADQVVAAAYEGLLGRPADEEGRRNYARLLEEGGSLAEMLHAFVASPEFGFGRLAVLMSLESLPPNAIQLDLPPSERDELWRHVQRCWGRLGQEEPHFSVLTSPEYRRANMSPEAVRRFYASGEADLARVERCLARHGRALPADGVCVDYGCGLGRVTLWLARRCRKVIAVDVSEPHLDLARRELAARGVDNVEFRLVRRRDDLRSLEGADFVYSGLVLQHNPPPVILDILRAMLAGLGPGAAAFFQVPTYGFGYDWSYQRFLTRDRQAGDMEMHVVPQSAVFALAAACGCVALEVQPDGCASLPFWMSSTFLFAKPARAAALSAQRPRAPLAATLLTRLGLGGR